ncbi:MAG TPA: fibronectin type III domain-containing protein, partial [Candidatus Yaniella excrementavium]|nr:fibronectin type III domain-containing protein [Candidatus Yaniella excrementavium]
MTRIHRWLPATSLTFGLAASGLVFIAPTHAQQAEPEPTTELVNETTEWNYLDDGNDPSNQASTPTAWTAADFDDADWNSSQGSFGAHAGEAAALEGDHTPETLLAQYDEDGTNTEAFFFRANFTVDAADLPDNAELTGSLIFDDAAVIYINGQRVTGFNDEQLAVSDDGEDRNMVYGGSELGAPAQEEFTVPADVLQAGQNTIAVQLHQASEDSSDVYFQFDSLQLTSSDNATDVDSDTDNAAEDTAAQTAEETADDTSETPTPQASDTSTETTAVQPTALADGQQWSYLDNGTDPANGLADRTDWTAPEFDDSGWDTAAGSFGALRGEQAELSGGYLPDNLLEQYYPDTDELNKEAFFFRTDVTIDDADLTQDTVLRGSLRYHDAAIVYVNGERIEGFHDSGLDFSEQGEGRNMVYGGSNSSAPNQGEFIVPNEHLKAGANTIAVQLHQGRDSSSDIYFELEHLDFDEIEATGDGQTSILLGMGADATERRLSWFTDSGVDEMVQLTTGTHKTMPDDADTIEATEQGRSADFGRDYVHATLADLTPGTYSYRVGSADGGWSDIAQFQVFEQDLEHSFTFFGDPQIGASGNVANDGQGWQEALDANDQLFPDSQFLLSAGDQINNYIGSVDEYQAYLAPEQMRSNAFAQTLGNHDSMSGFPQRLYHQHYNQPNLADYDPSEGTYWFKHNGVLHLNISTEYRDWDDHRQFLETTIAEHGD